MDKREAGKRIAEEILWRGKSTQQSTRNEETAASKRWEYQEVAQEFQIPVIYKPLNGSPIKIFPFARTPTDTTNQ